MLFCDDIFHITYFQYEIFLCWKKIFLNIAIAIKRLINILANFSSSRFMNEYNAKIFFILMKNVDYRKHTSMHIVLRNTKNDSWTDKSRNLIKWVIFCSNSFQLAIFAVGLLKRFAPSVIIIDNVLFLRKYVLFVVIKFHRSIKIINMLAVSLTQIDLFFNRIM